MPAAFRIDNDIRALLTKTKAARLIGHYPTFTIKAALAQGVFDYFQDRQRVSVGATVSGIAGVRADKEMVLEAHTGVIQFLEVFWRIREPTLLRRADLADAAFLLPRGDP